MYRVDQAQGVMHSVFMSHLQYLQSAAFAHLWVDRCVGGIYSIQKDQELKLSKRHLLSFTCLNRHDSCL